MKILTWQSLPKNNYYNKSLRAESEAISKIVHSHSVNRNDFFVPILAPIETVTPQHAVGSLARREE